MSVDTQYTVFGMTCENCVRTVTDAFTELPGVEQVAAYDDLLRRLEARRKRLRQS